MPLSFEVCYDSLIPGLAANHPRSKRNRATRVWCFKSKESWREDTIASKCGQQ